jgi:GNAT superfamily N-acetyltransferase
MITFHGAEKEQELLAILALQAANLPVSLSPEEVREQGFLTVKHTLDVLRIMNKPYAHTIAKDGDQLAGYALTMTNDFRGHVPILEPLFERLDGLKWDGRLLKDMDYVLMGQVCVAKAYRGQGVFAGLYEKMQERMAPYFELIVTEISGRNSRSLRAHEKVGFVDILHYTAPDGEPWVIVGLPTSL